MSITLYPESQLTISKGGSLRSANGENTGDGKVIANAGSTLGDIGSDNAIESLIAQDATLSGAIYNANSVILSGTNKLTNLAGTTIYNLTTSDSSENYVSGGRLKTSNDIQIDVATSSLTIAGENTELFATTTILLDYKESLLAKVGYQIELNKNVKFMPYVGGRSTYFAQDGTTLSSTSQSMKLNDQDQQQYIGLIGGNISKSVQYQSWYLQPFIDLNLGYNFKTPSINQRSVGFDNFNMPIAYAKNARVLVSGRLGMQAIVDSGFYTILTGGVDWFDSKMNVFTASLKLGYRF